MFNIFKKKKINQTSKRYWDFSYANKFFKEYKYHINLFELRMFNDDNVCERFMENGQIIKTINCSYQMYTGNIDGVIYTNFDIPCIHVVYESGHEEWIACYVEVLNGERIGSFSESHRKLLKSLFY